MIKEYVNKIERGEVLVDFNQWGLVDESGEMLAHLATKYNVLPFNFKDFHLISRGVSVAHVLAMAGDIDKYTYFNHWGLTNSSGNTVIDIAICYENPFVFNFSLTEVNINNIIGIIKLISWDSDEFDKLEFVINELSPLIENLELLKNDPSFNLYDAEKISMLDNLHYVFSFLLSKFKKFDSDIFRNCQQYCDDIESVIKTIKFDEMSKSDNYKLHYTDEVNFNDLL